MGKHVCLLGACSQVLCVRHILEMPIGCQRQAHKRSNNKWGWDDVVVEEV